MRQENYSYHSLYDPLEQQFLATTNISLSEIQITGRQLSKTPPKHKNSHDFYSQASTSSDQFCINPVELYELNAKLKTSLCRNYVRDGFCPYGDKCQFAHGIQELKSNGSNKNSYKTKLCVTFSKKGFCPYGSRCNFLHPQTMKSQFDQQYRENNFGVIIREARRQSKANRQRKSRLMQIMNQKKQIIYQIPQFQGQQSEISTHQHLKKYCLSVSQYCNDSTNHNYSTGLDDCIQQQTFWSFN